MQQRDIGSQGLRASAIIFGAMGLSGVYEPVDEETANRTMNEAIDAGITLIDTADFYGRGKRSVDSEWGHNESLVGNFLRSSGRRPLIATKGGYNFGADGSATPHGRPEYLKSACEGSLKRLGVETIDLYYLHRVDPTVPVEESVGAMAELVREGKVRYIGLSEASEDNIRRAHAVHPLSALQSEFSLITREPEKKGLPVCRELGIGLVAFACLGRGMLTASIANSKDLAPDDWRRTTSPQFQPENYGENLKVIARLKAFADRKGVTVPQAAIAWVLSKGDDVVALAGPTRPEYVDDNVVAGSITFSEAEITELNEMFPPGVMKGNRYPPEYTKSVG